MSYMQSHSHMHAVQKSLSKQKNSTWSDTTSKKLNSQETVLLKLTSPPEVIKRHCGLLFAVRPLTYCISNVWIIWNFKLNLAFYINITSLIENEDTLCSWPILRYIEVAVQNKRGVLHVWCVGWIHWSHGRFNYSTLRIEKAKSNPDNVERWTQERERENSLSWKWLEHIPW